MKIYLLLVTFIVITSTNVSSAETGFIRVYTDGLSTKYFTINCDCPGNEKFSKKSEHAVNKWIEVLIPADCKNIDLKVFATNNIHVIKPFRKTFDKPPRVCFKATGYYLGGIIVTDETCPTEVISHFSPQLECKFSKNNYVDPSSL